MGKTPWNLVIPRMTWRNLSCVFWDVEKNSEPAALNKLGINVPVYSLDFHGPVVFPGNHKVPSAVWKIQSGSVGMRMKDFGKKLSGKLPQTMKKLIWKKSLFILILNPVLTHKLPPLFLGMEKKIPSCFDKNSPYSTWNRLPSLPNPAFLGHLLSSGWHPCLIPEVFPWF